MAKRMYEEQQKVVSHFLKLIEDEFPKAFAYIQEETIGASTGLEYHDELRGAVREAYRKELIPKELKQEVKKLEKAIEYIFTS
jgi:hypothetical protein